MAKRGEGLLWPGTSQADSAFAMCALGNWYSQQPFGEAKLRRHNHQEEFRRVLGRWMDKFVYITHEVADPNNVLNLIEALRKGGSFPQSGQGLNLPKQGGKHWWDEPDVEKGEKPGGGSWGKREDSEKKEPNLFPEKTARRQEDERAAKLLLQITEMEKRLAALMQQATAQK